MLVENFNTIYHLQFNQNQKLFILINSIHIVP